MPLLNPFRGASLVIKPIPPLRIPPTPPSQTYWVQKPSLLMTGGGHLTQNGPISFSLRKVGLRTLESGLVA